MRSNLVCMVVGSVVSSVVLTAAGCAESEPVAPEPSAVAVEHAELGFLDVRDSVVTPWCSGVLIAPDVVLTSAHCVERLHPNQIRFGIGAATPTGAQGGLWQVSRVIVNPDKSARVHDLAALLLEQPIPNVTPVRMVLPAAGAVPSETAVVSQRLESITYSYVSRGERSVRTVWGGDEQKGDGAVVVVPESGKPSCECVSGAGMIDPAGNLLGLVAAGAPNVQGTPSAFCAGAFSLATVAHNQEFVGQALAASPTAVPVVP